MIALATEESKNSFSNQRMVKEPTNCHTLLIEEKQLALASGGYAEGILIKNIKLKRILSSYYIIFYIFTFQLLDAILIFK
jgi:hypothetical protein